MLPKSMEVGEDDDGLLHDARSSGAAILGQVLAPARRLALLLHQLGEQRGEIPVLSRVAVEPTDPIADVDPQRLRFLRTAAAPSRPPARAVARAVRHADPLEDDQQELVQALVPSNVG